jgi:single-strand DNA-binding protein
MAGYLKKVFIIGNLGRDPEARYSQDGKMYASFTVAVNDRPRRSQTQGADTGQGGQPEETTTWFRVTAFGRQAEIVNEYLRKGTSVFVSGDLSAREFIGNDGQKRTSLEVIMQDMQILTPKGMTEGAAPAFGGQPAAAPSAPAGNREAARTPEPDFDDEGDIPF